MSSDTVIFHPHGYLPRRGRSYARRSRDIVLSEDDYHSLYSSPYSWANIVQLFLLLGHVALFVGCSLTDPNLRRLLDLVVKVRPSHTHYAFLPDPALARGPLKGWRGNPKRPDSPLPSAAKEAPEELTQRFHGVRLNYETQTWRCSNFFGAYRAYGSNLRLYLFLCSQSRRPTAILDRGKQYGLCPQTEELFLFENRHAGRTALCPEMSVARQRSTVLLR